ncbi:MAG: RcnB family protein, partial [Sphingomonas sp.]
YDWNQYRQANRGAYRLPRYYAPSGWGYGYRRFSVGVSLSSILFSQNYWIDDPYAYRLPDAYGPYRWVRYYDDALLVDVRSGVVVDVVYDIFY